MKRTMTIITLMGVTLMILLGANQALLFAKPSVVATETMMTANQIYENGQFDQAAQAYQQLADQGFAASALYFNLGNAYFKLGDNGQAILNYRRAEHLAPRDEDIAANLALARTRVADQLAGDMAGAETTTGNFISRLGQLTQQWLTVNELAWIAMGAWFLVVLLTVIFGNSSRASRWREVLQWGLIGAALALALGLIGLSSRLYVETYNAAGVIVADEVAVTSGPGAQYQTELTLPGGTEIRLLEQRDRWTRLLIPGSELQGWVPANTVAVINR